MRMKTVFLTDIVAISNAWKMENGINISAMQIYAENASWDCLVRCVNLANITLRTVLKRCSKSIVHFH